MSCWDDGPSVVDRYTVVFLDEEDKGRVPYLAMDGHPTSPGGFGQSGLMPLHMVAYRGRGGAFKKRIGFCELPPACQQAVLDWIKAEVSP